MTRSRAILLSHLCAVGLTAVFLYASLPKIYDPQRFAVAIRNYRLLPASLEHGVAIVLPWIELVAGLAILVPRLRPAAGTLMIVMMMAFLFGSLRALAIGLDINCGCFGDDTPLDWRSLLKQEGILLAAVVAIVTYRLAVKRDADSRGLPVAAEA